MILQFVKLGCLDNSTDEGTVHIFVSSAGCHLKRAANDSQHAQTHYEADSKFLS